MYSTTMIQYTAQYLQCTVTAILSVSTVKKK